MSTQRETDSERPEEEVSLLSHEDRLGKTTLNEAAQYDESHPLTSENIDDGREQRLPRSRRKCVSLILYNSSWLISSVLSQIPASNSAKKMPTDP